MKCRLPWGRGVKLKPPRTWEWLSRLHPWGAPWAPVSRWHSNKGGGGVAGWGEPCLLPARFWVGPSAHCLVGSPHPPKPWPQQVSLPFHEDVGGGQAHQPTLSRWAPGIHILPDPGKRRAVGSPPPTSTWQRRLSMPEAAAPSSRSRRPPPG